MPRRTRQHEIADQALIAIQSVIAAAGFAVERVANDYGEDLLVQTSHAGEMDASRLWVQAKGTRRISSYARRGGCLTMPIQHGHLTRWARSADPVVIVLWDCAAMIGYYTRIDDNSRSAVETPTAAVRFERRDVFDVDAVVRLAWESRIEHYQRLILAARETHDSERLFEVDHDERTDTTLMITRYSLDLLTTFGALTCDQPEQYRLSRNARLTFVDEIAKTDTDDAHDERITKACVYTVLNYAGRLGVALPAAVLSETLIVLYKFIEPCLREVKL